MIPHAVRPTLAARRSLHPLLATALLVLPGCAAETSEVTETGEVRGEAGGERFGEEAAAQVVCAEGPTVPGIDVSYWQQVIDWEAVADSGVRFAIARVSHGAIDTFFDENWAGIKDAGLIRGAYQYYLADMDPLEQAEIMIDAIGQLGERDLPPVLDVESDEGQDTQTIVDGITLWLDRVEEATGRKPILYTGKYFWQDRVGSNAFVDHPLWIPNYSSECPDLPNNTWSDWTFFQHSSTGSVPGIQGNVDLDVFNGTYEGLEAFARGELAAAFVRQSFPYASQGPLQIEAGEAVEVSIELRNVGSRAWNAGTHLATTTPRGRESAFAGAEWPSASLPAAVVGTVLPGETYPFTFKLHAPLTPGVHDEFFGLVQITDSGETWFSDPGQGGPPDNQLEGIFEVVAGEPEVPEVPEEPEVSGEPEELGGEGAEDGDTTVSVALCSARPGAVGGRGGWVLAGLGVLAVMRRRRPRS